MTSLGMIRCAKCMNVLGEQIAGAAVLKVRLRNHGAGFREVVCLPVTIKCEVCQTVWVNPAMPVPAA